MLLRTRWLARLALVPVAGMCLLAGVGCAKPVVAAAPEPPPLAVPSVPPRLVGPVVVEEAPPERVASAPEPAATRPTTRPRPPRQAAGDNGSARPEGQNADGRTEAPVEPAASAADPGPGPLLRTPETADNTEAVRRVREIMARAQQNLSRVNPSTLSRGARANHDNASRYINQADGALKTGRLDYAKFLAEKAETLSGSLLKR